MLLGIYISGMVYYYYYYHIVRFIRFCADFDYRGVLIIIIELLKSRLVGARVNNDRNTHT